MIRKNTIKGNNSSNNDLNLANDKVDPEGEELIEEKISFADRIIIQHDAPWKSVFDVVILFLVGYSCISSLYYVAFVSPSNIIHIIFDWVVEFAFY